MLFAFDFDGTLVDTMPALEELAVSVLQTPHIKEERIRFWYRETTGLPFSEQLNELANYGITVSQRYRDTMLVDFQVQKADIIKKAVFLPHAESALLTLRARGHVTGIVSSTERDLIHGFLIDRALNAGWVGGIDVGIKSEQIKRFAQLHDVPTSCVFFMGDSARDRVFARDAGAHFLDPVCLPALLR